ncbi:MAG: cytochrome c oxidase subunit II [Bacteroidota bacterium]|nr:cytochrome c oxidase subunit II [Candidatus Kapabacteria bacterium]MDW8220954.1 cytochrome c oxidase subunit II [Bacteroidota bacterium]
MFDFSWNMLTYFPPGVSTYSDALDDLFRLVYWISVAIFLLVQITLVVFIVKYRTRPGHKSIYHHGNNVVEFVWTLAPTLLFAGLGLYSDEMWKVVKYSSRLPLPDIEIDVVGQAFNWHARYPGADGILGKRHARYRTAQNLFGIDPTDPHGKDDIVLTGEFNLPVNKNVVVHLSSVDVLHSYFLPNFRIKQDAVPGSWIDVWFNGTKPGKYELACAELCGSGHYAMRGVLNLQSDKDFAEWMDAKIAAKKAVLAAEAASTSSETAVPSTAQQAAASSTAH